MKSLNSNAHSSTSVLTSNEQRQKRSDKAGLDVPAKSQLNPVWVKMKGRFLKWNHNNQSIHEEVAVLVARIAGTNEGYVCVNGRPNPHIKYVWPDEHKTAEQVIA